MKNTALMVLKTINLGGSLSLLAQNSIILLFKNGRKQNMEQENSMFISKRRDTKYPFARLAKLWLKRAFRSPAKHDKNQESINAMNGQSQT